MAPSGESVLCGGTNIVTLPSFKLPMRMPLSQPGCTRAVDSESAPKVHPGWLRGIRIGSLKDGKVTMFVPPHQTDAPDGAMGEGIAIDAAGNLYTAEATVRGVTKYVKE